MISDFGTESSGGYRGGELAMLLEFCDACDGPPVQRRSSVVSK